jgi:hypothetical protein
VWQDFVNASLGSDNVVVSWASSLIGTGLFFAAPLVAYAACERFAPRIGCLVAGIVWGIICLPASTWLYYHWGTDCARLLLFGLIGVPMLAFHMLPAMMLSSSDVGMESTLLLCGGVWAFVTAAWARSWTGYDSRRARKIRGPG